MSRLSPFSSRISVQTRRWLLLAALCSGLSVSCGGPIQAGVKTGGGDTPTRTVAEQKIDSQLLAAIDDSQTSARPRPSSLTGLIKIDDSGRALVDIRADVTPALQKTLVSAGARILSAEPEYRSIVAWVPLARLKAVALDKAVYAIVPKPDPLIQ